MKNNRISILLLITSIIIQYIAMRESNIFEQELPFATGLQTPDSPDGNAVVLIMSFFPIPFFLLYFSETMQSLLNKYGQLLIIRNYSKVCLMSKVLFKIIITVLAMVIMMVAFYSEFSAPEWTPLPIEKRLQVMSAYALGIVIIVLIQLVVELYFESQYALTIANVVFAASLILSNIFTAGNKNMSLNYILPPTYVLPTKMGF